MKIKEYVKGSIHKEVLGVVGTLLMIEIILGVFLTDTFGDAMSKMTYWVGDKFGWWIDLCAVLAVILGVCFIIFRYGDIRIGGEDAKPEYSTWQWFSVSICGGIGCGLLFWAMGEPIYHYMQPPVAAGIQPQSREAAIFAVGQTMFDWSFVQYFIYAIPAVVFALLAYNCKRPLSFRALVTEMTGKDRIWLTTLLHIFCGYAVASGVSNSMAAGLMQIGGGLNAVFGLPQNEHIYLFITIFVAVFFILSCLTGINKGLTYVSMICMFCFFSLMFYVIAAGDAEFIGKMGIESFGNLLDNFFGKITYNNALADYDQWANGSIDIWANVQELGMQTALYQVLGEMPGGKIVQLVFLISVVAYLLVVSGGVHAVKGLLNIGGLLMTIPTAWLFVSLPKIGGKLLKCDKHIVDRKV